MLEITNDDRGGCTELAGARRGTQRPHTQGTFPKHWLHAWVSMAMNGWVAAEPAWRLNLQVHPEAVVILEPRAAAG